MSGKNKMLEQNFFVDNNTLSIAKELLGKYIIKAESGTSKAYIITETEAYDGYNDKASHAHRGKTERNEIMFKEGGFWYVYLVYGMHFMLNITTGQNNYPAAVLIRGVNEVNGPGRVTKLLKVNKALNKKPVSTSSGFWIEDRGVKVKESYIETSPRVGVDYAGEWAKKPYRFLLTDKKYII